MFGKRVYVAGKRIHHGLFGILLIPLGALLAWHDRHDWPWPLNDPQNDETPDSADF